MRIEKGNLYKQIKECKGEGTIVKIIGLDYERVRFKVIQPKKLVDIERGFISGQSTRKFKEWFSPVNRRIKRLE